MTVIQYERRSKVADKNPTFHYPMVIFRPLRNSICQFIHRLGGCDRKGPHVWSGPRLGVLAENYFSTSDGETFGDECLCHKELKTGFRILIA